MDQKSGRGLRTGNRGPEIGNRKKYPESETGRIGTGKGTVNRGKETYRESGTGYGTGDRGQETEPGNRTCTPGGLCVCNEVARSEKRRPRGSGLLFFADNNSPLPVPPEG